MRLWTLHPKYLDAQGLVALWRETLLARAVLRGRTRGYLHHPQLVRFRESATPIPAVNTYLAAIHAEALRRGYRFDARKLGHVAAATRLVATRGQLAYEWMHLRGKLRQRAPRWLRSLQPIDLPDPHPLFRITAGPISPWERRS